MRRPGPTEKHIRRVIWCTGDTKAKIKTEWIFHSFSFFLYQKAVLSLCLKKQSSWSLTVFRLIVAQITWPHQAASWPTGTHYTLRATPTGWEGRPKKKNNAANCAHIVLAHVMKRAQPSPYNCNTAVKWWYKVWLGYCIFTGSSRSSGRHMQRRFPCCNKRHLQRGPYWSHTHYNVLLWKPANKLPIFILSPLPGCELLISIILE